MFCNWHVLDRYKGRFEGYGLTRNMVNVRLYITECNVKMVEHFCYKYFSRSRGNPASLVENILKEAMVKLYDCYYGNNDYRVLVCHESFRCYTGEFPHSMDTDVPSGVIGCLPNSYYKTTYPENGILKRVHVFLAFNHV